MLERLEKDAYIAEVRELLTKHHRATGSTVAAGVLDRWHEVMSEFVQVMPVDYKRVLAETDNREAA